MQVRARKRNRGRFRGSLLTRAALVLLFAGVNAQLSIVSQWRLHDPSITFHAAERSFLEENVVGLGRDGEVEVVEDRQSFKKRIIAVPTILAKRVDGQEVTINIGTTWGEQLLKSYELRNTVVHAPPDEPLPRVAKAELRAAIDAVRSYFGELHLKAPETFKAQGLMLQSFEFSETDSHRKMPEPQRRTDGAEGLSPQAKSSRRAIDNGKRRRVR